MPLKCKQKMIQICASLDYFALMIRNVYIYGIPSYVKAIKTVTLQGQPKK